MDARTRTDLLLLAVFCGFLFFYGLGAFGLVGADEPRYAQIAREMLDRSEWVTPTLLGKPWLEKPVLYYWEAMVSFRLFGVTDRAARLPGALDAAMLVAAVYFFLRRFRRGSELDGALIAASCAGMIGFAHAASTDMPLSSCFAIALLGWYGWYESRQRSYLLAFYLFLALGTLAKGPVAPALAAVVILIFLAERRDWRAIWGTLWIPGIVLFFVVALPWYVAVQIRNPEFFRFFILEHNLARFSTGVYHHPQPFWFYVPVFLLAMMPWAVVLVLAIVERVRVLWARQKPIPGENGTSAYASVISAENRTQNPIRSLAAEPGWPLFLSIWMMVPIVFFSASHSKLPGYILPAVPAAALLVADYLEARRATGKRIPLLFASAHGVMCGLLVFAALCAAGIAASHHLVWLRGTFIAAAIALVIALGISVTLLSRAGPRLLTRVTMFAVVVSVAVVIRFAAPVIDATQSARGIAERIQAFSHETVPVGIYHINRVQQYGLEFYLNRGMQSYESGAIPAAGHVVVAARGSQSEVALLVPGRRVSYLTSVPGQKLELYWVK
jgi:4-amino-4-deoxy-L-arabinose transferase-like glycosyltransferase